MSDPFLWIVSIALAIADDLVLLPRIVWELIFGASLRGREGRAFGGERAEPDDLRGERTILDLDEGSSDTVEIKA